VHDYTRKGGIAYKEIMLPANAPDEYLNRSTFWNAVEKVEKARNSQLAREVEFALPAELTQEQNIALARDYVKRTFVDEGSIFLMSMSLDQIFRLNESTYCELKVAWKCSSCGASNHDRELCEYCNSAKPTDA